MPWVLLFLYSWILFFLFVDRSRLNRTVYGGLIAALLGTAVDAAGHYLHLYRFFFIGGHSYEWIVTLLHALGPMFTMGTLFFQCLSPDPRLQAGNVLAFSLSYLAMETLIIGSGGAVYMNWHYLASLTVDILVFTAFSYVGGVILFDNTMLKIKE